MKPCHLAVCVLIACIAACFPDTSRAQLYNHYSSTRPSIPSGSGQLGFIVSYAMPRNYLGVEFDRGPAYELYYQVRSKRGFGPFTGRIGVFYTDLAPRLDSFPSYLVMSPSDKIIPGHVSYSNLNLRGLYIDYAYSVLRVDRIRLDLGLGLTIGQYKYQYTQSYPTVISITDASIQEFFVGLRPKVGLGFQLNKYFELYGEYKYTINTSTDWSAQFPLNTLGIGLHFTFKPGDQNDGY